MLTTDEKDIIRYVSKKFHESFKLDPKLKDKRINHFIEGVRHSIFGEPSVTYLNASVELNRMNLKDVDLIKMNLLNEFTYKQLKNRKVIAIKNKHKLEQFKVEQVPKNIYIPKRPYLMIDLNDKSFVGLYPFDFQISNKNKSKGVELLNLTLIPTGIDNRVEGVLNSGILFDVQKEKQIGLIQDADSFMTNKEEKTVIRVSLNMLHLLGLIETIPKYEKQKIIFLDDVIKDVKENNLWPEYINYIKESDKNSNVIRRDTNFWQRRG